MIYIDMNTAKRLLGEAVKLRGEDFRYRKPSGIGYCMNVHQDDEGNLTPGCIVGTALHLAGIPLEEIPPAGSVYRLQANLHGVVEFSPGVVRYLREAQMEQDMGYTWGDALRMANAIHS